MPVHKLTSKAQFERLIRENHMVIIHFYTEWVSQCGPMNSVVDELAKLEQFKEIAFAKMETDIAPEIAVEYKIAAVPACVIFKGGRAIDFVKGANPAELTNAVSQYMGPNALPPAFDFIPPAVEEKINALLKSADIMVFMKGNPAQPKCGYSKNVLQILDRVGLRYETFDILSDEDIRQGLKTYSSWPTYPQVYARGELIGGIDIIRELEKNGQLAMLKMNLQEI